MRIGVYSGSFDPITNGHTDVIIRAAKMVDKLFVAVLNNPNKKYLFSLEERADMAKKVLEETKNIEVKCFEGLLVNFMRENNAEIIIRGLRAVSDYEYELTMAYANNEISDGNIETIFLPASKQNMYLSSSIVREISANDGRLDLYVDNYVEQKIRAKNKSKK
ncbi:MAG: pantetheine-phosphate adenylyltransferase [Fusobacteriaceae bacterium]